MAIEVEGGHGRVLDLDVAVLAQDAAYRRRDFPLRQDAGCHLVEQRLEEVVVHPVDQRHLHRCVLQEAGCEEAAETAAHDDDTMRCCRVHLGLLCIGSQRPQGTRSLTAATNSSFTSGHTRTWSGPVHSVPTPEAPMSSLGEAVAPANDLGLRT